MKRSSAKWKVIVMLLPAFIFLAVGTITLSDYGMNWDGPGHMLQGQANAQFLLTGKKDYPFDTGPSPMLIQPNQGMSRYQFSVWENPLYPVRFPNKPLLRAAFLEREARLGRRVSFYESNNWSARFFLSQNDPGHPPQMDIVSALFNRLFYQRLGWFGDIESYQLWYVVVASLGVAVAGFFAWDLTGSFLAGLFAGIALALFPAWIGEAHVNMKDPLAATFFAGTVWMVWCFLTRKKLRYLIFMGGFVTLGLGVKWTIFFVPITLLPWLFTIRKTREFHDLWRKKAVFAGIVTAVCSLFIVILTWPYLWGHTVARVGSIVGFYRMIGTASSNGSAWSPLRLLFGQTPDGVLFLFFVGVLALVMRDAHKRLVLLLGWFVIALLRVSLPGFRNYGGIRQMLDVLFPVVILAGIGASSLCTCMKKRLPKFGIWSGISIIALYFAVLINTLIRLHPNENLYFNAVTGGLNGAAKAGLVDWMASYGNIYKQGVEWLNSHAEKDANLTFLSGSNFAISPLWLRPDISFSPDALGYEMILYGDNDWPESSPPVYEVVVGGVPMLSIYNRLRK